MLEMIKRWIKIIKDFFKKPSPETPTGPIDLKKVRWLDLNIEGWAQTATLNARLDGVYIRLGYDKARVWPIHPTYKAQDGGDLVGNCWIFVKVDGIWHTTTWDWMRPGQQEKQKSSVKGGGGHIQHNPLKSFVPKAGEEYGFMVSGMARGAHRTVSERSNVSMVTWV